MSEFIKFVEAQTLPICPHCEKPLAEIEFRRDVVRFGFFKGETFVVLLSCPHCHKVLSTQSWE